MPPEWEGVVDKPVKIYSSAKVVELQVIQGKLEACDIEAIVEEQTFQGPGKLHQLLVAEKDKDRAIAIIKEANLNASQ